MSSIAEVKAKVNSTKDVFVCAKAPLTPALPGATLVSNESKNKRSHTYQDVERPQ